MKKINTIEVPLPLNSNTELSALLSNYLSYKVNEPSVRHVKNTFVTHQGLVLKNGLLVKGCAFNLIGNEDNTFYYQFWRDTIEKYAVCKWGKSLPSIHLKSPKSYLLIHSKWFNYSFWITDFLPRLINAEKNNLLRDIVLIVPEGWNRIPYVWDSLKVFDVSMEIIPNGTHLFVDNLIMPETRKWTSSFQPLQIQSARQRLVSEIKPERGLKENDQRIYLSRSKRGVRCVENEEQVLEVIKQFNYTPVVFEELTIWEQIALMNRATHLISIHGAGFSNMMFMKANATVLELINKPYAKEEYTFPFWKLANAAGLNYYAQLCEVVDTENAKLSYGSNSNSSNEKDYLVNKNIVVNLEILKSNLKLMKR